MEQLEEQNCMVRKQIPEVEEEDKIQKSFETNKHPSRDSQVWERMFLFGSELSPKTGRFRVERIRL